MRAAIAGAGTAGCALAILLSRAGHDVTLVERAEDPGDVGAGLWLQSLGQQVLDRLGLLDQMRAAAGPVSRVDTRTLGGRVVMDFGYADVAGAVPALGVHRGDLFELLWREVLAGHIRVLTGATVTGCRPSDDAVVLEVDRRRLGGFDLVVGADGAGSAVREAMSVTAGEHRYRYGAWWAIVDDPEQLAGDVLFQRLDSTTRYLGVLPTGRDRASIFWSAKVPGEQPDLRRWREEVRPFAADRLPLTQRVQQLLPASYRHVRVRETYRSAGRAGAVLVGDAAHAMSPSLGTGATLALADAWSLAHQLECHEVPDALAAHARSRRAHVRWYQWWTRLMTPTFQSDLRPLAWPRDLLAEPLARIPVVRRQLVHTLEGGRTSPWSGWALDAPQA